jgi:hypothetical protein
VPSSSYQQRYTYLKDSKDTFWDSLDEELVQIRKKASADGTLTDASEIAKRMTKYV